jgi:hypothetical protein
MSGRWRSAAAAVAATVITYLVWLSVQHDSHIAARLGPLPVAAALWAAFAAGAWLALGTSARRAVPLILLGGIAIQLAAMSAPPRSSDDLYRYIWDGRVQSAGIDPYRYVPAAAQLTRLRDRFLWPANGHYCVTSAAAAAGPGPSGDPGPALAPGCTRINRPTDPTIYPPVAEAYFTAVYELSPPGSGATPIQAGAALFAIATTGLLMLGLRSLDRDPRLAVLWAWCPAVGLEAGNTAHVDVVAAFFTAAALLTLSRAGGRRRALCGGVLLGLAISTKITPVLVAPAILRRRPVMVAAAAVSATAAVYLPHLLAVGRGVIGFLPGFLTQDGYASGNRFLLLNLAVHGRWATIAAVGVLTAVGLAVLRRANPDQPWRGALVMSGAVLAVTTPFLSWYSLLLVMLVAMDGRAEWLALSAARYLTPGQPFPHVLLPQAGQVGYGAAVAFVAAVSLVRLRRRQGAARGKGREALDAGADDYSAEPFGKEGLLGRMPATVRQAGRGRIAREGNRGSP